MYVCMFLFHKWVLSVWCYTVCCRCVRVLPLLLFHRCCRRRRHRCRCCAIAVIVVVVPFALLLSSRIRASKCLFFVCSLFAHCWACVFAIAVLCVLLPFDAVSLLATCFALSIHVSRMSLVRFVFRTNVCIGCEFWATRSNAQSKSYI